MHRILAGASTSLVALIAAQAHAQSTAPSTLPSGGVFVAGQGTIAAPAGGTLTVSQSSARGVIDWRSFSIGGDGKVLIDNGAGATLNRVIGGDMSRIDGVLKATGSLYLINSNGVVIGSGGRVVTGGSLVVSTRDIANGAFMAGGSMAATGASGGGVVNRGEMLARNGDVIMIGRSVTNSGTISAANGAVSLAAADSVLLATVGGPDGVYVAAGGGAGDVANSGVIDAAAVALRAAHGNVYTLAGNRTGAINATGTATVDGQVWLTADQGTVEAAGVVSARNADGAGGTIVANGRHVMVDAGARLDATGTSGGTILAGVSPGRQGIADTLTLADGARILTGGGGFVETSAHRATIGALTVDAGKGGHWLVDPVNLTIDAAAASTIVSSLNGGTSVTEYTNASAASGAGTTASGNGDIIVASAISWSGSGNLTLNAYNNLNINAAITSTGSGTFTGTAGSSTHAGAVNVSANIRAAAVSLTATGGNLTIGAGRAITATSGITLATTASFVNNGGASALQVSGGRWLVYSANPANDTPGGLAPDFYQYNAPAGTAAAASGNGLLHALAPTLSVALSGTVAKTYDGTTDATFAPANAAVTGLVNGDTATVTGSYAQADAGTGIDVTASAVSVAHGGVAVYGYGGVAPNVTAAIGRIDPKQLTASIVGTPTKTYNGTATASLTSANYQLAGFVGTQGATVDQASSVSYAGSDAGAQTVNATFANTSFIAGGGTNLANYILPTTATGAGYINPASLLVTGLLANSKVYNGVANTRTTLATGNAALYGIIGSDNVVLDTSGAVGDFASGNVGNNLAVATSGFTISGAQAHNYTLVQPAGLTASITPAAVTVSGITTGNKIYDGTTAATLDTGNAILSGVVAGETITLNGAGGSAAFATANAGSAIAVSTSGLTLSGATSTNYTLVQPTGLTASITPRPLSVGIGSDPTKVYDGTTVVNTLTGADFTFGNLVAGQGITIQNSVSAVSYDNANAGARTVTARLAASDYQPGANTLLNNYILPTTVSGAGTITQAPLEIQLVGNPTKQYDGTATATVNSGNFRITGFIAGEGARVARTSGLYDSANAGARTVTVDLTAGDFAAVGGTLMSNYAFPAVIAGSGTITPAPLTANGIYAAITGNPTKVYDGTNVATLTGSDFTLSGFIGSDGAIVTQTMGSYASANAGSQLVTASLAASDFTPTGSTNLANYTLPTVAYGTGAISQRQLTAAIIGTPTKTYNGTTSVVLANGSSGSAGGVGTTSVSSGSYRIDNLVAGESITVNGNIGAAYASANAGAQTVSADFATSSFTAGAGTLLGNYILPANAAGAGLITQAPLTILGVSSISKTYDGTTGGAISTAGAMLYSVVSGDTIALSSAGATSSFTSANAGTNVAMNVGGFTISGADTGNYQLIQPTGISATIFQAPVTISGVAANRKIYDGLTGTTLNSAAASLNGVLPQDGAVRLDASGATGNFTSVAVGNGLSVIASGYGLSGSGASNYILSQPTGLTANITPRPLTLTITGNPTKVYDGTTAVTLDPLANFSLTGFVAGQGASVSQTADAAYVSANAGTGIGINVSLVSSDYVAAAGTILSNYILPTTGTGTGTITPAPLVAKIVNNPTKTYDTTTGFSSATANTGVNAGVGLVAGNYQITGFVGGDGATVSQTAGTYGGANAGSRAISANIAGYLTATGTTDFNNYILPATATGFGTITPAQLTINGVNAATPKVYDGTTVAYLNNGSTVLQGLLGNDRNTVTLNTGGSTGAYSQADVGNNLTITTAGYSLSGTNSGNYTLIQPTLTGSITPATLNITNVTKVYDSTTGLPTANTAYALGGVIGSDQVYVNAGAITGGSYASQNAGTGIGVTAGNITLGGAKASNYQIASTLSGGTDFIGTITPRTLTVAIINNPTKVYDGTTAYNSTTDNAGGNAGVGLIAGNGGGSNYRIDGLVGTDAATIVNQTVGAYGSVNVLGANGSSITAALASGNFSFTSGLSSNYRLPTIASGIGTITPLALTGAIIANITKVYDGTVNLPTANGAYTLSGVLAQDKANVQVNGAAISGSYASSNAGSGILVNASNVQLTGSASGNYSISPTLTNASVGTITPKALTVSGTRTYDGQTGFATGQLTVTGAVYGETIALTTGGSSAASRNVGSYAGSVLSGLAIDVTGGNGLASNYTLPATGTLTITKAPLTITGGTNSYVYTGVTQANTYAVSGTLFGSDSVTGVSGNAARANVGMTADSLSNATGSGLGNYAITYVNGALTITPAPLTITGKTDDTTYTSASQTNGYTVTGLLGSDSVTGVSGRGTGTNVGTYVDNLSNATGSGLGNYLITYTNGALTIDRAALAITGDTGSATYNGATQINTYTVNGLLGGDRVTGVSGLGSGTNVGSYADNLSNATGSGLNNYAITYTNGALTIDKAALTITGGSSSHVYNGATQTNGYSVSGLFGGDSVNGVSGSAARTDVGTTADSLSNATGSGLGNYAITYVDGALTITPAALTIAGNTSSATYTAGVQTNGYTVSGLLGSDSVTGVAGLGTGTNAGSYADSLSSAIGSGLGNYVITYTNGALTIDKAALVITGNTTNVTYNGATHANTYAVRGLLGGDRVTGVSGLGTGINAGSYADNLSNAIGSGLANYDIAYTNGALTIDKAALTITGDTTGASYSGLTQTNGYTVSGLFGSDSVTGVSGLGSGVNAGNYADSLSNATGSGLGNYAITYVNGTLAVVPKTLTIGGSKTYDGTVGLTTGQLTVAGAVSGETITLTAGAGATASANAGSYAGSGLHGLAIGVIGGSGLASNYALPTTGTLTIDQAALTIAGGTGSRVYNGATQANSFTVSGTLYGNDSVTGVSGSATRVNVGTTADSLSNATGSGLSNYAITYVDGALTITPAALTIAGNTTSGVYSGTRQTNGYTVTGLRGSDSVTGISGRGAGINVGSYVDNLSNATGPGLGNYLITYTNGVLAITPKALAIGIVGNPTKMADGTASATLTPDNYAVSGFVAGEGARITQTVGAYDGSDAGDHVVSTHLSTGNFATTPTTNMSNYSFGNVVTGPGTITPAVITSAPNLQAAIRVNLQVRDLATPGDSTRIADRAAFGLAMPRIYIPYPAPSALQTWVTNAFAPMPSIVAGASGATDSDDGATLTQYSGGPVINSTAQILLQGDKDGHWVIRLPQPAPARTTAGFAK